MKLNNSEEIWTFDPSNGYSIYRVRGRMRYTRWPVTVLMVVAIMTLMALLDVKHAKAYDEQEAFSCPAMDETALSSNSHGWLRICR